MTKIINQEILTLSVPTVNELIGSIQTREQYISNIRVEMIKQWYLQGQELQQLQLEQQCSQNALTGLTGISKASVYNYISISKDPRILELVYNDHRGGQLDPFNQKQLVKLTKLEDCEFEESVEAGILISANKEKVVAGPAISFAIDKKTESKKAVIQISSNGEEIARYPSASMAQFITGVDRMSIGKICRGEDGRNYAGGCQWEFAQNKVS